MRTKSLMMVAAVLLTAAGARAQDANEQTTAPQRDVPQAAAPAGGEFVPVNQVDIGIRGTSFGSNSDQARFQRYQDLRDGGTLDKFRFFKETNTYGASLQADHVGYRDQRFFGSYNNYGTLKATFQFDQTPLFYSETARSLYTSSSPGVLVIPQSTQQAIQNKTMTLQQALTSASPVENFRSKRSLADFKLLYSATQNVDLNVFVKNTQRDGSQPMTASFGFSGVPDELAAPVDNRTTEFGTSIQYGNDRAYAKVGYEGSFFRNNVPTLTWSNPFRASDSTTAGPQNGRMALWPNTDQNTLSVSAGANKLPGHTHVSGMVAYTAQSNNDALIPFTINQALAPAAPALPRTTAEVKARVTAMNFNVTSRPISSVWFSARYRQYQFDNQSTPFASAGLVSYDYSLSTSAIESEPLGFTRHTFDGDVSFSPVSFIGIRGGYTREVVDRTFRVVDTTTEDVGRASIDVTGTTWLSFRGVVEHAKRVGSAVNTAELLDLGEQPGLGQYDIADRTRDRVTGIVIVTPVSALSFNASAGRVKDDYPASQFGLRNGDDNVYQIGFDAVPIDDKVTFGLSYGYEKNNAQQASRYAAHVTTGLPPTFNDPRADWFDDSADKTNSFNASLDVLKIIPKVDVKVGYDYSKGTTRYAYSLAPNSILAAPQQVPDVTNELTRGIVDVMYHLTSHLGAGLTYAYDRYAVNDFSLGPQANGLVPSPATVATPSIMMLGYYWMPYSANTFWGRLSYRW